MKENYGKWCILFGSQDLWEIVNNGYADPMAEEEDRYTLEKKNAPNDQWKEDKKALSFLYQGLGCYNFEKVSEAATSKELWDKLGVIYKGVERVKKLRLQK